MTFLIEALLSCLLTAGLIVWLRRPALRFGLVDHTGGRKRHGGAVPRIGGLSLTLGFSVVLLFSASVLSHYAIALVAVAALAAVGLLDDMGEVSARTKLAVQALAALLMTSWANLFLTNLGNLFGHGPVELRNWGIPLTLFATVAVINGLNMLDGLDGLAGGVAFSNLSFFAFLAAFLGDLDAVKLLTVLLGAIAGFLAFNLPHPWRSAQRRTFLGDTGSLVLGFFVAWFSVALTQQPAAHVPPIVMPWVLGVILLDTFTVTIRRTLRRRDPTVPDRGHIHHLLLRRGFTERQTLAILLGGNALLGLIGIVLWRSGVPDRVSFLLFLGVVAAYVAAFLFPNRLFRRRGRAMAQPEAPIPGSARGGGTS